MTISREKLQSLVTPYQVPEHPILFLTSTQRAALVESSGNPANTSTWFPPGAPQHIMWARLISNGLLRRHGRTTEVGKLALAATNRGIAWWYSTPALERAHDVRRMSFCQVCDQAGLDLPRFGKLLAHGACLVKACGWAVVLLMPQSTFDGWRLDDFRFLGIHLADVELLREWQVNAYGEVMRREKASVPSAV